MDLPEWEEKTELNDDKNDEIENADVTTASETEKEISEPKSTSSESEVSGGFQQETESNNDKREQEPTSSSTPSKNQESLNNETSSFKNSEVIVEVQKAVEVEKKSIRVIETPGSITSKDTPEVIVTSPGYLFSSTRNGLLKPLNASTKKNDKIHHSRISAKPVILQKPIHIQTASDSSRKKKSRLIFLKRCSISFLLTAAFCGYALGGAYLFSYLERRGEIAYNEKIDKWKNDTAVLLATELRQVLPHEEIWARKIFQHLEIYERDLLKASAIGYRREDDDERGQRWTIKSALFFSISLMTTTGYGSMTPRSEWGRTAVVCFSLMGIPLFCSWLFIIGYYLSLYWSWMFQNICCHMCSDSIKHNDEAAKTMERKDSSKTVKIRSNSIVPYEELKSDIKVGNPFARPEGIQNLNEILKSKSFPVQVSVKKEDQPKFVVKFSEQKNNKVPNKEESIQTNDTHLDNAVATVFAGLLLVVYFVFGSIAFALCHAWTIVDSLYFNYLMFITQGPGCHEYESEKIESHIKQDISYSIFLLIGYCFLSMFFHLFYMVCKSVRQK